MRTVRILVAIAAGLAILVAACGGGAEPVPVRFTLEPTTIEDQTLRVVLETDLPDGAFVRCAVLEGEDDEDFEGLLLCDGAIQDGRLVAEFDVSEFTAASLLVTATFAPWIDEQPEGIAETYGRGRMSGSAVRPGPPADPDRQTLEAEQRFER